MEHIGNGMWADPRLDSDIKNICRWLSEDAEAAARLVYWAKITERSDVDDPPTVASIQDSVTELAQDALHMHVVLHRVDPREDLQE